MMTKEQLTELERRLNTYQESAEIPYVEKRALLDDAWKGQRLLAEVERLRKQNTELYAHLNLIANLSGQMSIAEIRDFAAAAMAEAKSKIDAMPCSVCGHAPHPEAPNDHFR